MNRENKIREFLDLFNGTQSSKILCHSIDDCKSTRMRNRVPLQTALRMNDELEKDVYFYVNNGGTKKNEIDEIVAVFVDIDTGRDENGDYYPTETVQQKKREMLEFCKKFPIEPSVFVETRNGFHIYWLLEPFAVNRVTLAQWETAMGRAKTFFREIGADHYVGKPNQLMRLPFTVWSKSYTGLKPFTCLAQINNTTRLSLDEFLDRTNELDVQKPTLTEYIESPSYTGPVTLQAFNTWMSRQKDRKMFTAITNRVAKKKVAKKQYSKSTNPQHIKGPEDLETILNVKEFLLEIAPQLHYKQMRFSSKQARELADRLSRDFGI